MNKTTANPDALMDLETIPLVKLADRRLARYERAVKLNLPEGVIENMARASNSAEIALSCRMQDWLNLLGC